MGSVFFYFTKKPLDFLIPMRMEIKKNLQNSHFRENGNPENLAEQSFPRKRESRKSCRTVIPLIAGIQKILQNSHSFDSGNPENLVQDENTLNSYHRIFVYGIMFMGDQFRKNRGL